MLAQRGPHDHAEADSSAHVSAHESSDRREFPRAPAACGFGDDVLPKVIFEHFHHEALYRTSHRSDLREHGPALDVRLQRLLEG